MTWFGTGASRAASPPPVRTAPPAPINGGRFCPALALSHYIYACMRARRMWQIDKKGWNIQKRHKISKNNVKKFLKTLDTRHLLCYNTHVHLAGFYALWVYNWIRRAWKRLNFVKKAETHTPKRWCFSADFGYFCRFFQKMLSFLFVIAWPPAQIVIKCSPIVP